MLFYGMFIVNNKCFKAIDLIISRVIDFFNKSDSVASLPTHEA